MPVDAILFTLVSLTLFLLLLAALLWVLASCCPSYGRECDRKMAIFGREAV